MLQGDTISVRQHLSHMKQAAYNQHVAVPAEELQQSSFLRPGSEFPEFGIILMILGHS